MSDNLDGKTTPLTDALPTKVRKYLYWAYAVAGIVLGALQIAEVNTGKAPEVLAYIGIALGALAGSNVRPTPPAV
jgi:hypothetical protein